MRQHYNIEDDPPTPLTLSSEALPQWWVHWILWSMPYLVQMLYKVLIPALAEGGVIKCCRCAAWSRTSIPRSEHTHKQSSIQFVQIQPDKCYGTVRLAISTDTVCIVNGGNQFHRYLVQLAMSFQIKWARIIEHLLIMHIYIYTVNYCLSELFCPRNSVDLTGWLD
jgi:hypothetical protein